MANQNEPQPSVISGALKKPFPEQVAFFRNRLGNLVPTARWTDMQGSAHDTGFMVAGAAKADLLSDMAAAVDRVASEGGSIESFRKDFASIVQKNGWTDYTGEFGWRTRVIYTTNAQTSYSAGRLAQLREGGFAYWVYRHNDSVRHPRPLHLAWNGLTLPSDDKWWHVHYPPNGWGCRCYVIGARNEAGAKRVGGEPDKKPPRSRVNPKTGEPAGIDKGWGYMPGDTVSDTVSEMANKTRQWQYEIAKAYMQDVPAGVRDRLATSYRALPSVADDARRYAQRILENRTNLDIQPYRTLGLATSTQAQEIGKLAGVNVDRFDFAIDKSSVRHIESEHGSGAAEGLRGQRAVTASDYARLPEIIDRGTITAAGKSDVGHPIVRVESVIDGERYVAAFEVRRRRKMLALQSFWVGKPRPASR